jgi:hypothetical protein
MHRSVIVAASAIALLALPGCGHSGGPATYLSASGAKIDFIQWQESSSGSLQGTIIEDEVTGTAPSETISANSAPFTGTVSGSSVNLHFSGFLGIQANIVATLSGSTLTLQVPQNDGTIQQDTFATASVGAFNKAVSAFRGRIQHANILAAQAQTQQQQQEASAAATARAKVAQAAADQAKVNRTADSMAEASCNQFGGSWNSPGVTDYTADGYTFSIPDGPQDAACDQVPYLGSDDSTYYVTIEFSSNGMAQPAGEGTGTATESECERGYYPDASAGPASAQPGNWSSVLGICLPSN